MRPIILASALGLALSGAVYAEELPPPVMDAFANSTTTGSYSQQQVAGIVLDALAFCRRNPMHTSCYTPTSVLAFNPAAQNFILHTPHMYLPDFGACFEVQMDYIPYPDFLLFGVTGATALPDCTIPPPPAP